MSEANGARVAAHLMRAPNKAPRTQQTHRANSIGAGSRGRILGAFVMGCLGSGLLGCLDGASETDASVDYVGSWVLRVDGCVQQLRLSETGNFSLGVRLPGAEDFRDRAEGIFSPVTGEPGSFSFRRAVGMPLAVNALVYCDQWRRRTVIAAPRNLDVALGRPLDQLRVVSALTPTLGPAQVWVSDSREAIAVTATASGRWVGYDVRTAPGSPFYTALPEDPVRRRFRFGNESIPRSVIDLPEGNYGRSFTLDNMAVTEGVVRRFYLNFTAAVDLEVGLTGTGRTPACRLLFNSDRFGTPVPVPLMLGERQQTVRVDPKAGQYPFWTIPVNGPAGATEAYLWGVSVWAQEVGTCHVSIRATSLAASALESLVVAGGAAPLFDIPLTAPGRMLTLLPADREGGAPVRIPARPGLLALAAPETVLPDLLTYPTLAELQAGGLDWLGLGGMAGKTLELSATRESQEPRLILFPQNNAGVGLGPFVPSRPEPVVGTLPFPGRVPLVLPASLVGQALRLELASPRRLELWSTGGLDTRARLANSFGETIAAAEGGAADGVGFRILAELPAGDYRLEVSARQAGTVDVIAAAAPTARVPDTALEHCLLKNGWSPQSGSSPPEDPDLDRLVCLGEGIRDLSALDSVAPNLTALALAGNRIADLAPITGLLGLQVLSLESNPLTDATPLTQLRTLRVLRALSLAYTAVTPASLVALCQRHNTLAQLDLTGVSGLSAVDLETLQELLPRTIIIGPDGEPLQQRVRLRKPLLGTSAQDDLCRAQLSPSPRPPSP